MDIKINNKDMPLVSILIPTFNRPVLFKKALESALNQTYENIEIVVGDDSSNNDTQELIKDYLTKHSNIRYYHNESNLGQFDNDLKLLSLSKGEYINLLMDDDLFKADKIEKMMEFFIKDKNNEISLVTSHRYIIDENDEVKGVFGRTEEYFKKTSIIKGENLANFVLVNNYNCIGEPTTVLFKKSKLTEPFGVFCERRFKCNVDQATWFNLLSSGKAVFINEALSCFRIHKGQQQFNRELIVGGAEDYAFEVLMARKKGLLLEDSTYIKAAKNCLTYVNGVISKNGLSIELQNYKNQLEVITELKEPSLGSKEPLVSILIPAYNQTEYLKLALESALYQNYQNIEIIVGDDSTDDRVKDFLQPYISKYKSIKYFKNETHDMDYGLSNNYKLLELCNGEYVNFLYHDDLFHKDKISRMMKYFIERNDIGLVTSHRQLINERGEFLKDNGATRRLFQRDAVLTGCSLCLACLNSLTNLIGEPTTVLFKKSLVGENFGYYNKNAYINIIDLATWFTLLSKGNAVYISDSLSYFRQHENQNSRNFRLHLLGVLEWRRLIENSFATGLITDKKMYEKLLLKWFKSCSYIIEEVDVKEVDTGIRKELIQSFSEVIEILMNR